MIENQFSDKIVFVTGGTSGIGLSIALKFAEEKAKVIICGRNSLKNLIEKHPDFVQLIDKKNIEYVSCDISKNAEVINCKNTIEKRYGTLDILVNNAGVAKFSSFLELEIDDFDFIMNVNFKGQFLITKAFLPGMIEKKSGMIINLSSVATYELFENCSIYNASKAAFLAMSKTLRKEVRNDGIKVIDILPGATASNIWDKDVLQKNSHKMMSTDMVANVVFNTAKLSFENNLMIEEIEIRPQNGNL